MRGFILRKMDNKIILRIITTVIIALPLILFLKSVFTKMLSMRRVDKRMDNDFFNKKWDFVLEMGDLDGFPDTEISIKFRRLLNDQEKAELKLIFKDWYDRCFSEINNIGSEFGGLMHYMGDIQFEGDIMSVWIDFGSVGVEEALNFLFEKLSQWNKGVIDKVVFGIN